MSVPAPRAVLLRRAGTLVPGPAPASRRRDDPRSFELVAVETRADWITRVASDLSHAPVRLDDLGILQREHLSASRFSIDLGAEGGKAGVPSQLDGEEWIVGDHFDIEVLANRLRLKTPADFVPPWKPR